ncbi:MAG: HDOD domain-containing protein [Gammaproteobacteria bacterium]|nr:HDOD domain-containing protein [Gammaproteobacteria bacterium]
MKRDPLALVKRTLKVASLPTAFIKVDEAINNPRSSNKHLANIINEDAAIAAKLLRIANSGFYSFPAKIETVTHAITIIGTQQLRDLVLACSVVEMFKNIPEQLVNMESFWRHSIATAVTARILANYRRDNNVERFFVAGLLHDIGRLVIFAERAEEAGAALNKAATSHQLLYRVEYELFGFNHATLGGMLLKEWNLPPILVETVKYHHHPSRAKQFPIEASLVQLADLIANATKKGSSGEQLAPQLDAEAWAQTGLTASILPPTLDQLDRQYADAVNFVLGAAAA